jgi:hypothetical protein
MSWRGLGTITGCLGVLAFMNASAETPGGTLAETYVGANGDRAVLLQLEPRDSDLVRGWIESIGFDEKGRLALAEGRIAGHMRAGGGTLFVGPLLYAPMPLALSVGAAGEDLVFQGDGDSPWSKPLLLKHGTVDQFGDEVRGLASRIPSRLDPSTAPIAVVPPDPAVDVSSAYGASACECSEEKRTHVAEATHRFSLEIAALSAEMAAMTATSRSYRRALRTLDTASHDEWASGLVGSGPNASSAITAVRALWITLETAQGPVSRRVAEALRACRERAPMPGIAMPPEAQEWDRDCETLAQTAGAYASALNDLTAEVRGMMLKDPAVAAVPAAGAPSIP